MGRKSRSVPAGATALATDNKAAVGTTGGSQDRTASAIRGWLSPPKPTLYDSGFGYRYLSPNALPVHTDRIQCCQRVLEFNCRGFHAVNSGAPVAGTMHNGIVNFLVDAYPLLTQKAEMEQGYRHTPTALTDTTNLRNYVNHWVSAAMNTRTLLGLGQIAGYNAAATYVSGQVATLIRRATRALGALASLPMPQLFRDFATSRSEIYVGRPGAPVCWDLMVHARLNWGTNNAYAWVGNGQPTTAILTEVMEDIELSIDEIIGRSSDANDNVDYRAIITLLNFLNVPKGLAAPAGLQVNPYLWDDRFRNAWNCIDTHGIAGDQCVAYPDDSQTFGILRRGMGPVTPFVYGGMGMVYAADFNQLAVANDGILYGCLRHGCTAAAGFPPGTYWNTELYNEEDGWLNINNVIDYGDATALVEFLSDQSIYLLHDSFPAAVTGQAATPEARLDMSSCDWEFYQSIEDVGEIYRVMLGQAFGIPSGR